MSNRKTAFDDLIDDMRAHNNSELASSLRVFLDEGTFGNRQIYTRLERHVYLISLFKACDPSLQDKIRNALASLLEAFEPMEPPTNRDLRYLFQLLSLSQAIRSQQAKERLRRWLYAHAFEGWRYDIYDLYSELILATSTYDSDDEWTYFLLNDLPKRPSFKESALAAYRAVLQTRRLESLSLLPDILAVEGFEDPAFFQTFGLLMRQTIRKVGTQQFCKVFAAVLKGVEGKSVIDLWTVVLRFDQTFDRGLAIYKAHLSALSEPLIELWQTAVSNWESMKESDSDKMLDMLFDRFKGQWDLMPIFHKLPGSLGAVIFCKKYPIVITKHHSHIYDRSQVLMAYLKEEVSSYDMPADNSTFLYND